MPLSEIYQYLEDNVTILYRIRSVNNAIDAKIAEKSIQESIEISIEKAVFTVAESIKTNFLDWMNRPYEIISQNYSYLVDRITQTQNSLLKAIYSEILYYSNEPEYKSYIKILSLPL